MPTKLSTVKQLFIYSEELNKVSTKNEVLRNWDSSRTGDKLTNWKRIIQQGNPATTGFSGYRHEGSSSPGTVRIFYAVPKDSVWPDGKAYSVLSGKLLVPSVFTPVQTGIADADNQAIVRITKDIQANYTQFCGQTFLGELRETIGMLRRPARGLLKGLDDYARGLSNYRSTGRRTPRQKRALRDAVTGSWLEVQYGLNPLLNDIKGITEQIARLQHDFRQRVTGRGYGASEAVVFSDTTRFTIGSYGYGLQTRLRKTKSEVIYKAGLSATLQAPFGSVERVLQNSGFTFEQFVPTLWELVPYSFVVDYFSNIGDILTCACSSQAGVRWVNKTVRTVTTESVSGVLDHARLSQIFGPSFLGAVGAFGRSFSSSSQVSRTGIASIPVPSLQLSLPGDTSLAWLNMAALVAQFRGLEANFRR